MFSSLVSRFSKRPSLFALLALLATVISVARICVSYHEISMTADEPSHIAPGMQFIDRGQFTYEVHHPPLARMATAILPYLDGARSHGDSSFWNEGIDIVNGQGTYWRTLTLARLGILPFYIIGVFLLWSWTKKLYGDQVAFFAVLCYTFIPPVLAHAGLATTDTALTTGIIASCYALWWWLRPSNGLEWQPTLQRSIIFGLVAGFSAATKISFLSFFPVAAFALLVHEFFASRKQRIQSAQSSDENSVNQRVSPFNGTNWPRIGGMILIVLLSAWMALWACFGFSYGPIPSIEPHNGTRAVVDSSGAKYPAPEFFAGITAILKENHEGHAIYFMGKPRFNHASPWFFPVTLGVKTPLAILLLAALGAVLVFYKSKSKTIGDYLAKDEMLPLLISSAILLSVLPSNINIGVRHVLAIYPFIAMLAALGARWLWSNYGLYGRIGVAALMAWMIVSSMSSGSDRIAYFNELASASSAAPVILDSDIDWGQDLDKLADTIRARGIQSFNFVYFGHADFTKRGIKNAYAMGAHGEPTQEWVAISKMHLYASDGLAWLRSETPAARIGNSILLYHFTPADLTRLRSTLSGGANIDEDIAHSEAIAANAPTPVNFLNLSLAFYNAKRYNDCIAAARKAIELKPDFPEAFNNVAVGFLKMSQWDSAIAAATEAVRLKPDFQLAKNNLASATEGKNTQEQKISNLEKAASEQPTPENYLDLSVAYYQAAEFQKCIAAARKAIALRPEYAAAYSNICAANNRLGNFAEGKKAGEQAVRIDPDNQLAKNNLKWSLDALSKK